MTGVLMGAALLLAACGDDNGDEGGTTAARDVETTATTAAESDEAPPAKVNVERFRDEYGLTFPIPLDTEGEVSRQYLIGAFPTTFILDEDGVIQEKIIGPMTYEWMVEQIRKR
jgi:alkyl hydroperoxide reductase subunit AhpC